MDKEISLGKFISIRRKQMYLTQEELANIMHVSKSAIAKWETDGGIPDRDNLRSLALALKVSINELHKLIDSEYIPIESKDVNITPDVIAALEAHGYKVIRPDDKED